MNPTESLLANQYESGQPTHTLWDIYAEQHNPVASANHPFVPDVWFAHGGNGFTQLAPKIQNIYPDRLIVWDYNQNYSGVAPMELQPQYNPPPPYLVEG